MRLAPEESVTDLFGFDGLQAKKNTAKAALELATSTVERHIGTSFRRRQIVDFYGSGLLNVGSTDKPKYELNLTQGYVDSTEPFAVYYSNDGTPINLVTDSNSTALDSTSYKVDYEKGKVSVAVTLPDGVTDRILAVSYTAGFETDNEGLAEDVPENLQSAASMAAAATIRTFTGVSIKTSQLKDWQNGMRRGATSLLNPMIRLRASGADPDEYDATNL